MMKKNKDYSSLKLIRKSTPLSHKRCSDNRLQRKLNRMKAVNLVTNEFYFNYRLKNVQCSNVRIYLADYNESIDFDNDFKEIDCRIIKRQLKDGKKNKDLIICQIDPKGNKGTKVIKIVSNIGRSKKYEFFANVNLE